MSRQVDHYDPLDGSEPTEPDLAHDVVRRTVPAGEPWAGREWEECRRCGARGDVGSIDPFAACPARVDADLIASRASSADADDSQSTLSGACVRADGGADQ